MSTHRPSTAVTVPRSAAFARRLLLLSLSLAALVSVARPQSQGSALGLASMEVDIAVGSEESEVTATLQFTPRSASRRQPSYDFYLPVYVPEGMIGNDGAMKKYKPALSVERRPVILRQVPPPPDLRQAHRVQGMEIVWWKAVLRWPRRGEALIVDMRYLQRHAVAGGMRRCHFLPIAPDGPLTKQSRIVLHTDLPGTALHLRSGKLQKRGFVARWTGGSKRTARSLACAIQHNLPVSVDLVAE